MDVCKQSSDAGRAAIKTEHLHAPSSAASASSTVSNSSSIDPRIKLQQQQNHQQQNYQQQQIQQQQIQQQQIITQNPIQSSQNHPPLQMQSQTHQTNMLSQDQARLLPQQHPAITVVADPIPVQAPIPVQTQSGLPMAGHKRSAAVAFAQHADGQRPPPSMPIPTPLPIPLPIPIPIPTLAPTLSSLGQSVALPVQSCSSAGNSNTNYSSTGSNNSDEPIPQSQSNDLNQQPLTQQQQQQQQQNPQQHPSHPTTAKIPSRLAPLNRSGKNLSEKKIRRLEKNRLSARNCRKKKKEYTQNLQTEIMILEGDNLRLRLQLQIGQEAEQSSVKEQERVTEQIDDLLKSGASDPEIYNSIEMFKEKFADYGRDRRSAIEFHLRNAERLLMPTTTTSIAMRALEGGSRLSSGTSSTVNNDESGDDDNDNDDMGDDDGDNDGMGDVDVNIDFNEVVNHLPSSGAALDQGQDGKPSSSFIAMPVPVSVPMEEDTAVKTHVGDGDGMGTETPAIPKPISQTPAMNTTATSPSEAAQITSQDGSPKLRKILQLKNTEPKELFAYLVKFLQVTPEQSAALKDSRHVASELDSALEKSLAMLGELRERLTDMGQNLDAEFSAIRLILTPTQTAKFLVWVANNGACMHMLNELWSKVYPEPVSNDADDDDNDNIDDDDDDGDDDDGDDGEDDNDIDDDDIDIDDDDNDDDDDGDDGEEKEIPSNNE